MGSRFTGIYMCVWTYSATPNRIQPCLSWAMGIRLPHRPSRPRRGVDTALIFVFVWLWFWLDSRLQELHPLYGTTYTLTKAHRASSTQSFPVQCNKDKNHPLLPRLQRFRHSTDFVRLPRSNSEYLGLHTCKYLILPHYPTYLPNLLLCQTLAILPGL